MGLMKKRRPKRVIDIVFLVVVAFRRSDRASFDACLSPEVSHVPLVAIASI
jgi:hypothetical protein